MKMEGGNVKGGAHSHAGKKGARTNSGGTPKKPKDCHRSKSRDRYT